MKPNTVFARMLYSWLAMPLEEAKQSLLAYMLEDGDHAQLDVDLVYCSETTEEAIQIIFSGVIL